MEDQIAANPADVQLEQGNPEGVTPDTAGGTVEQKPINWEKRYQDSTRGAEMLKEKLANVEGKLSAYEKQQSSLTSQSQQDQQFRFPDRTQFVRHAVENGDKTEKEAMAEYERDYAVFSALHAVNKRNQELERRLNEESKQREEGMSKTNPVAQDAVEFFKDIPSMDALSLNEKIATYQKLKPRVTQSAGLDLSAIKGNAGGTVGGGGGGGKGVVTPMQEAMAKAADFPSYAAMQAYNDVTTEEENKAWEAKYKPKK